MSDTDDQIDVLPFWFVQINDVYHIYTTILPVDEQSYILPRVSTLVKRARAHIGTNRVFFCLPGDFLAPSGMSRWTRGEHMIDVLNTMDLDAVSLGNHEFDVSDKLYDQILASKFLWITTNFEWRQDSWPKDFEKNTRIVRYVPIVLDRNLHILLIGLLAEDDYSPIGSSSDAVKAGVHFFEEAVEGIADGDQDSNCYFSYVAMTHQDLKVDIKLAAECDHLYLVMGAHDHAVENESREGKCLIVKGTSNATIVRFNCFYHVFNDEIERLEKRGVNTHELAKRKFTTHLFSILFDLQGREPSDEEKVRIQKLLREDGGVLAGKTWSISRHKTPYGMKYLFSIGIQMTHPIIVDLITPDQNVVDVIEKWIAKSPYSTDPIFIAHEDLEITDKYVRSKSTNFGNFVADVVRGLEGIRDSEKIAEIGLINGGSFRIDRVIHQGEAINEMKLADVFFHDNEILLYELKGANLRAVLEKSLHLAVNGAEGSGEFLQISGLTVSVNNDKVQSIEVGDWENERAPLDDAKNYLVATTKYVAGKPYRDVFGSLASREASPDVREEVGEAFKFAGGTKSWKELPGIKRTSAQPSIGAFPVPVYQSGRWIM